MYIFQTGYLLLLKFFYKFELIKYCSYAFFTIKKFFSRARSQLHSHLSRVIGFFTTRQLCSQLNVSSSVERAWRSLSENADHFYSPEPMIVGSPSLLFPDWT